MGAIKHFVVDGMRDAERRLGAITRRQPLDEAAVMDVVEGSAVTRTARRVVDVVAESARFSRASALWQRAAGQWSRGSLRQRRIALGLGAMTAATTHVALAVVVSPPVGWLWVVIPSVALAVGLLLIASAPPRGTGARAHVSARRIRVLALSPIPEEGAGCRFRVAQYVPYLRQAGFDVTISPFYTPAFFKMVYQRGRHLQKAAYFVALTLRRLRELSALPKYDLVLLYREAIPIGPPVIESVIAMRGIPIVYDFDDAIFLPNVSEANKAFAFLKNPGRIASILRRSREVIAGNEYLAAYARNYHSSVTVIPTAVDTRRFAPRTVPRADGELVVGWIGSPTTYPYLEALAEVLREVAARHRFILRVSGAGRPVRMPGVNVQEVPWTLADEVTLFNTCDVGVYPLTDDEWSKGKCGFKAIQCMSCGVPVVAAAVGVNRDIIVDGVNSFLAATPDEWVEKLGRLLADEPLRQRMAAAGRRTIEEQYSLDVTAPRLAAVLASALDEEPLEAYEQ
jgi:glycosyltransferase involved in cell wall biosynthesis